MRSGGLSSATLANYNCTPPDANVLLADRRDDLWLNFIGKRQLILNLKPAEMPLFLTIFFLLFNKINSNDIWKVGIKLYFYIVKAIKQSR